MALDRSTGDGRGAAAGRRSAGAPRRRSHCAYRRARRCRLGQQSDRRSPLGAQTCPVVRRVRGARHGAHPPQARIHFKLDGPAPAAAEILRLERLRDIADAPFDPSTIRGTVSAQVTLGMPIKSDLPPGSTTYAITVDATNFSAERMIMGQRVDAALLRATATPQGFQLKGDVRIGATPVSLDTANHAAIPKPKSVSPARSTRRRETISALMSARRSAATFRSGSPAVLP